MSRNKIIRAWKNEAYRNSLSESERAQLPEHPAGQIELSDSGLDAVSGGLDGLTTYGTYTSLGWRCFTATTRAC